MPLTPSQAIIPVCALSVADLPRAIESALAPHPPCRIVSVAIAPAWQGTIDGAVVVIEYTAQR